MRISLKIRCFDDPDDLTSRDIIKSFNFDSRDVKTFEPSDLFPDHTTIFFYDDSVVEAIVKFQDFEHFIMPPDHKWFKQTT